ncbi:MAG TPA: NAD-dependent epimerase/dehydratase family protein [Glaciibacter sp.]|nr:NAD-dependent epimerase/dehydratase family protein [Glaciibacter sp.]
MRILVTGANGFIGRHLCALLLARGHEVGAAVRRPGTAPAGCVEILVGDLSADTQWHDVLACYESVVHMSARVHIMDDTSSDPLADFRSVNTEGTRRLAKAAAEQGVARFVFLSSIKVNGEATNGRPFTAGSALAPADPYGVSKMEAELALWREIRDTTMTAVVVRTPLVFGPGVKGNFIRMLAITAKRIPLPLGSVKNRRSMVSVWNLTDLIERAAGEPDAAGTTIVAADAFSPSTPQLLRELSKAMRLQPRIIKLPVAMMRVAGVLTGKSGVVQRLVSSLEVEPGSSSSSWSWTPALSFQEGIQRTVDWYVNEHKESTKK